MQYSTIIASPFGKLGIQNTEQKLLGIDLLPDATPLLFPKSGTFTNQIVNQLNAYLNGNLKKFNLAFALQGTPFQIKIWEYLATIPFGTTKTYGEIAQVFNTSPRAIGNACRTNPILIVIPCHRVKAMSGIGGFRGAKEGYDLDIKKWLLKHERVTIN